MKEDPKSTVSLLVPLFRASLWFSMILHLFGLSLSNVTKHPEIQNNQMFNGFESLDLVQLLPPPQKNKL